MTYLADMAKLADAAARRKDDATHAVQNTRGALERAYDRAEAARIAHDHAIAEAYRAGVPAAELARMLGVSRQRVHRITTAVTTRERLAAIRAAASGEG